MLLKNKSIEELLDLEEELQLELTDERDGTISKLISVYETLFKQISVDRENEYITSLDNIKKKLISYLVQYGTYLKTVHQKDDHTAASCLRKALSYERNLPIAHYRLGFIYYKQGDFYRAISHFQMAIHERNQENSNEYRLNAQQLYNGHLFLANCGLFIAQQAQEGIEALEFTVNKEKVPQYEMSPFYQMINENDLYLENHAYQMFTDKGSRYCNKEFCEDQLDLSNTIILDLTRRQNYVGFNGEETSLSINQMEMLRLFLLKSRSGESLTKNDFFDLFANTDDTGEIPTNTYTQNVTRLRTKLQRVGIEEQVIENKVDSRQTAYFYNRQYPFLMMHRSDDTFILNQ